MRTVSLSILLFTISGCPDTEVATQGEPEGTTGMSTSDGMSSTSADAPSTGEPTSSASPTSGAGVGLDCIDLKKVVASPAALADKCEAHPFERAPGCETRGPLPTCEEMITLLAETPACADVDICDYYACADAMISAPCGDRPSECAEIINCLNAGQTEQPLVAGPPPVLVGCNIPIDMCDTLALDCLAAGIDEHRCLELAQAVCPDDKCLACDRAVLDCEAGNGDCEVLTKRCAAALQGCGCEFSGCRDVAELELPELFSLCFAWPLSLGHCDDPSAGQCMTTLPWTGCAGLTACEYATCMEKVALFGTCDENIPIECAEVEACIASEASGR